MIGLFNLQTAVLVKSNKYSTRRELGAHELTHLHISNRYSETQTKGSSVKMVSYVELVLEQLAMTQAIYIYKNQFRSNFSTYMYYMGCVFGSPWTSDQDLHGNWGFHV